MGIDGARRQQKEEYEWRTPNRFLVVQLVTSAYEVKVFRAHAAPQGLRENLINALKLLANSRRMKTARFRALQRACKIDAEKASWTG